MFLSQQHSHFAIVWNLFFTLEKSIIQKEPHLFPTQISLSWYIPCPFILVLMKANLSTCVWDLHVFLTSQSFNNFIPQISLFGHHQLFSHLIIPIITQTHCSVPIFKISRDPICPIL